MSTGATPRGIDFRVLDGIRGIAALYVVLNHARGRLFVGGLALSAHRGLAGLSIADRVTVSLLSLTRCGREFVMLFFVLSGFSIAASLSRPGRVTDFWIRRALRIYPPYIIAIVWAAVAFFLCRAVAPESFVGQAPLALAGEAFLAPRNLALTLVFVTFTGWVAPFWSLVHEVLFYALAPLLLAKRRLFVGIALPLTLIGAALHLTTLAGGPLPSFVFEFAGFFAVGVWLHDNYERGRALFAVRRAFMAPIAAAIFLAMIALSARYGQSFVCDVLGGALGVFLLVNFLEHGVTHPALRFLGERSYTLYVTHYPTIILAFALYFGITGAKPPHIYRPWVWPLAVVLSVGVAAALFVLGERWTKPMLARLRTAERAKDLAPTTQAVQS